LSRGAVDAGIGAQPLGYQWRKDGAPLSNRRYASGANTATLRIDSVGFSDVGQNDVVITNDCGSQGSYSARLMVIPDSGDLGGDADVDAADHQVFRAAFGHSLGDAAYNPRTNYDTDGCTTLLDYQIWLAYYRQFAGDPHELPPLASPGDMNCDGVISFVDINPIVRALSSQSDVEAQYSGGPWLNGDCSGDGIVSYADINPFVALLAEAQ
jgi:hypothetical protein